MAKGVAIVVRRNLKAEILKEVKTTSEDIEIIGVKITGLERTLNIFAIYRKPSRIGKERTWRKIIEHITSYNNVLLIGDFNAHSSTWNCVTTDRNRKIFQEELEDMDFFVVNRNTMSRMSEAGSRPSNSDLIFCLADIFELVEYKQLEDSWGSNHYPD